MDAEEHRLELMPLQPGQHHITLLPKTSTDLPFFYLTKQKALLNQPIRFDSLDTAGRPMRWKVTPNTNPAIGAPAIEAHEVWVRLVMPAITLSRGSDDTVRDIVPLGRMRESLRRVGWSEGGFTARRLLKALHQIGSAWCVADFWMPTNRVDENGQPTFTHVKGAFSRMAIYAIGSKHLTDEQLNDGKFDFDFDLEDVLYVQLHPMEVSMQQSQPPRLVDNEYLFSVGPSARRWYELVAPKIFGAVKHKREHCEISYSWYVRHHHTLKRHHERHRVLVQMQRIVEDHIRLGYIERVEYRAVKEPGKEIDFLIRYYPGPAAKASIERMRKRTSSRATTTFRIPAYSDGEIGNVDERFVEEPPRRKQRSPAVGDHPLQGELVRRGIIPLQAEKLLSKIADDQPVIDQLEWGDHLVAQGQIQNPPGFYTWVLKNNISVPAEFETAGKRQAREEAQRANDAARQQRLELEERYRQYIESETDQYIQANLPEGEYDRLIAAKRDELLQTEANRLIPDRILSLMATGAVRSRVKIAIAFTTFEAFCQEQEATASPSAPAAEPTPNLPPPSDPPAENSQPFVV